MKEPSEHCCVCVSRLPRNMAEPYGSSNFRFWISLHTDFYAGYTNLHSHQQCIRIPFPIHPHYISCFVFFILRLQYNYITSAFHLLSPSSPKWQHLHNINYWFCILPFSIILGINFPSFFSCGVLPLLQLEPPFLFPPFITPKSYYTPLYRSPPTMVSFLFLVPAVTPNYIIT